MKLRVQTSMQTCFAESAWQYESYLVRIARGMVEKPDGQRRVPAERRVSQNNGGRMGSFEQVIASEEIASGNPGNPGNQIQRPDLTPRFLDRQKESARPGGRFHEQNTRLRPSTHDGFRVGTCGDWAGVKLI